jgi:hypothetical protein
MERNNAQNVALVSAVLGLIVVATLLLVGNRIYFAIDDSITASTTSGVATQSNITSNTNSAMSLAAVAPLVVGASLILMVILGFATIVSRL